MQKYLSSPLRITTWSPETLPSSSVINRGHRNIFHHFSQPYGHPLLDSAPLLGFVWSQLLVPLTTHYQICVRASEHKPKIFTLWVATAVITDMLKAFNILHCLCWKMKLNIIWWCDITVLWTLCFATWSLTEVAVI